MSTTPFDSRTSATGDADQTPERADSSSGQSAPPAYTSGLCDFCQEREPVWTSPTGHLACQQCRFNELHRLFSETYWTLMEIRATLDKFGDWLVDSDADTERSDHR